MCTNYNVIIRLFNLAFNDFPLLFVSSAEHFHTNWNVAHFKNSFNHLIAMLL